MPYAQTIIDTQDGQVSQLPSEKLPLGTYARLLHVRSKNGELESIGGASLQMETNNAVRLGHTFFFEAREFIFYVRADEEDNHIEKTFFAEVVDGVSTDLESGGNKIKYTETRDPSIAIAPEAFFVTFGDTVKKIKVDGETITPTVLAGANNVVAICFGEDRIYGISGRRILHTDRVVDGDVTTFASGDGWLDGGRFPSILEHNGTNIQFLAGKLVVFTPSQIQVSILKEQLESDPMGSYSVKRYELYGEIRGVGTQSFRQLGHFNEAVYFVDEKTKQFYRLIPQKDKDGRIYKEEIKLDRRNFQHLHYDRYLSFYSNKLQSILIACKQGAGFNDTVILYNPEAHSFAQKRWAVSSFAEDYNGSLYFTKDNEAKILQYEPEIYTEEENERTLEIEMNDFSDPAFWKKLKVKRLAFWFLLSPETKVQFFQSIDGGDFTEADLKLSPTSFSGSFISARPILGRTPSGISERAEAEELVSHIVGKAKVKAKGTTVRYLLKVQTNKRFVLKKWAITNFQTIGKRKRVNIRVRD